MYKKMNAIRAPLNLILVIFLLWSEAHRRQHQQLLDVLLCQLLLFQDEQHGQIGTKGVTNKSGILDTIEVEYGNKPF